MKPKVKNKNNEDNNFDFMKTNKDNIKNVIRDENQMIVINDIVIRTNKIVIHSYQFLKLYLLDLYENNKSFPVIDKEFICDIFKVITIRKCGSGGYTKEKMPTQQKTLQEFYDKHYKETICNNEILYYDKLSYILAYEAIDMVTNINNNIMEHFIKHMNKFVNLSFNLYDKINEINKTIKNKDERKEKKNYIYGELKKIKKDLITCGDYISDNKYHEWITEQRKFILPNKTNFDKNSIMYDIKSNTQDYIKPFIYLGKQIEKFYDMENKDNHKIRLFNILPLRTNIVPKNIVIDTCGLIQNLLGDKSTTEHLKNYKQNNNQFNLWNGIFKLNKRVFKKSKYSFHNMIRTDGISISILFVRNDNNNKPMKKCPKNITKEEDNIKYIENVIWTNEMKNKKIITIDPNLSDLIYCGSKDESGNLETFRYTQNQRRMETRTKKYKKIIEKINNETKINDVKIKEIETELSKYNSKSNNYDKFKEYLVKKNKLNINLFSHYEQNIFRKFKLNRFINTQKSESKLIKNFSNKFGKPKDTMIILGDYDKGNNHMKGVEPTINKRLRRIFKNAGFDTYLINEFRTSKLCNCCHNELEPFLIRESKKPRDKKLNKKILINGLLCHQDIKPQCKIIHNRDKNAVQNMLYIIDTLKLTGKRPDKYSRVITA
jgi:hypothetical protein